MSELELAGGAGAAVFNGALIQLPRRSLKRHSESGHSRTIYITLQKEPCSIHNVLSSKQSDKFFVVILVSYLCSLLVTAPCTKLKKK